MMKVHAPESSSLHRGKAVSQRHKTAADVFKRELGRLDTTVCFLGLL